MGVFYGSPETKYQINLRESFHKTECSVDKIQQTYTLKEEIFASQKNVKARKIVSLIILFKVFAKKIIFLIGTVVDCYMFKEVYK